MKEWQRLETTNSEFYEIDFGLIFLFVEPSTTINGDDVWSGSICFKNNKGELVTLYENQAEGLIEAQNELIRRLDMISNQMRYINELQAPGQTFIEPA